MKNTVVNIAMIIMVLIGLFTLVLAESRAPDASIQISGTDLYRINCQSCHGPDGKGQPPDIPSLWDFSKKLNSLDAREAREAEQLLRKRLHEDGLGMPAFDYFTKVEENAVVNYLRSLGGEELKEDYALTISAEKLGEQIVKANCTSCHSLKIEDGRMGPASLAGATDRFTKTEIFNLLDNGFCMMPSFDHFTTGEKEALYSYLTTLERSHLIQPTMGEICPMARVAMSGKNKNMRCCMQR